MYRIVKVLNNNSILVKRRDNNKEYILLGNGIGFGKKPDSVLSHENNAKVYSLVNRETEQSSLNTVNKINPIFIEITAKIIDEVEKEYESINKGILVPLADHISLAVDRAKKDAQFENPFNNDIKIIFSKEYEIALKAKEIIKNMTGYEICDSEVGFITLHIHTGVTGNPIQQTLNVTRVVEESMKIIENDLKGLLIKENLGYNRLKSYLYYVVSRIIKDEKVDTDINDIIANKYPDIAIVAEKVCDYIETSLCRNIINEELGFMIIHIKRAMVITN